MSQNSHDQSDSSYIIEYLSSVPIEHMDLSLRTKGILKRTGLKTALDLQRAIATDELIMLRYVGPWTINDVESSMRSLLENGGIDLSADEINLIVIDELKTVVMIPTIFYEDLPIEAEGGSNKSANIARRMSCSAIFLNL